MAELFADVDLDRRAPRAQRMLRTLGGSVALHALFVLAVLYVPIVRNTFQLASTLSGLRFVNDPNYQKTDVRERAIMLDTKLYYPRDYFLPPGALAQAAPTPDNDVKLVSEYKRTKPTPTPTPSPTPSPSPSVAPSPAAAEVAANKAAAPGASPSASASPAELKTADEAEKVLQETKQEKFPPINTAPFTDLLQKGKTMKDAGEIDLSGTLELTVEADRTDDGTLTNVEITGGAASDAKLKDLAKAFIAALSESKALAALNDTHHLRMNLLLDDQQVSVRVMTEVASEEQARQKASGYRALLAIGAISKKGHDEEAIFKNIQVKADARQIVLGFTMPRKDVSALLTKLTKKTESGRSPTSAPSATI
jgi:hypothetical protein